eukprot:222991-Chlamydomonas_euryale.AAC.2
MPSEGHGVSSVHMPASEKGGGGEAGGGGGAGDGGRGDGGGGYVGDAAISVHCSSQSTSGKGPSVTMRQPLTAMPTVQKYWLPSLELHSETSHMGYSASTARAARQQRDQASVKAGK